MSSHSHIQPEDSISMEILEQRQEKEGGGEGCGKKKMFVLIRHREHQPAPDWTVAFGCSVLIGCCSVAQFGSYISLLAAGDLSLMNLSTVRGVDNKNFKISL